MDFGMKNILKSNYYQTLKHLFNMYSIMRYRVFFKNIFQIYFIHLSIKIITKKTI
jgi:hypothetical protein